MLTEELKSLPFEFIATQELAGLYLERIEKGSHTRDENRESHFTTYFLPVNPQTGKVFLVHHKKSGLWIAPGGHIDKGEGIKQSTAREIGEEVGVKIDPSHIPQPFLLTVTEINNPPQICRQHFDIWHLLETDGSNFEVDPLEFHEVRWLTLPEAQKLVVDLNNLLALSKLERLLLPARLYQKSISSSELVLSFEDAQTALIHCLEKKLPVLGWEGWVKDSQGKIGHTHLFQGDSGSLENMGYEERADFFLSTIKQVQREWLTSSQSKEGTLYFCLTMGV